MSEPLLILEGRRAASWLAAAGHLIGLESPACYRQPELASDIVKLDNEICLVRGRKLVDLTEENWRQGPPDGVLLHRLSTAAAGRIDGLFASFAQG